MTKQEMIDLWNRLWDEIDWKEKVPESERLAGSDFLHGMVLLDRLVPGCEVSAAEHDEVWLSTDLEELAKAVSEDQVRQLVKCRFLIWENESIQKFV